MRPAGLEVKGWCFSSEFSPHLNLSPCRIITLIPRGHRDKTMAYDLLQRVGPDLKSLDTQVLGAMSICFCPLRQHPNHKGPGSFLGGVSKIDINRSNWLSYNSVGPGLGHLALEGAKLIVCTTMAQLAESRMGTQ